MKLYLVDIEMHNYTYENISNNLPEDIVKLLGYIHEASAKDVFRKEIYAKEYEAIQSIAKLASVKYSNSIENIISSDERIQELILRGGRPLSHTEEEIAGYGEALDIIHTSDLSLSVGTFHRLHSLIRAGLPAERGQFKTRDNVVASVDENGNKKVVLRTVPHQEVSKNIAEMLDAYLIADSESVEPLILIPCFIVDYLCIHPYMDGNGRTSRLLTYMMLYSHGIDVCRYVSLDEHIAMTKGSYYDALHESSLGWDRNNNDYVPFIRYFLRMLYECYIDLDTRFAIVGSKGLKKSERVEYILKNSLAPMSKRQLQKALPDISYHTVDSAIKNLLEKGRIEKVGEFRNARYRYKT